MKTEYSAREVCPQSLLIKQVLRAHAIFLLHHAQSLEELFLRLTRAKFSAALDRFWTSFIRNWEVLLNGNPAVDMFDGIKLAAGGELGIGVGEEEWGSGEREVLEGFVGRTDGLVDLIVSRFGEAAQDDNPVSTSSKEPVIPKANTELERWLGAGRFPSSSDGVIFSGLGGVSRTTLKSISAWMEWLYQYGQQAYGVENHPNSARRKKRRRVDNRTTERSPSTAETPLIPPSIFKTQDVSAKPSPVQHAQELQAPSGAKSTQSSVTPSLSRQTETKNAEEETGTETLVKYLTLGVYGSSWGIPFNRPQTTRQQTSDITAVVNAENDSLLKSVRPEGNRPNPSENTAPKAFRSNDSFFLIGLKGDLEVDDLIEDEDGPSTDIGSETESLNQRFVLRSLHVERNRDRSDDSDSGTLSPGGLFTAQSHPLCSLLTWGSCNFKRFDVGTFAGRCLCGE